MKKIDDYTLISKTQQESFWKIYLTSKEGTETKYATKVIKKKRSGIMIEHISIVKYQF